MIQANNKRDIFFLCIGFSIWLNVLMWVQGTLFIFAYARNAGNNWAYLVEPLPYWIVYGLVIGIIWSSFGIPLLRRKTMRRTAIRLAVVVTPVTLIPQLTLLLWVDSHTWWTAAGVFALLPTVAFLCTCAYTRKVIPDISYSNSQCQHCGSELARHCLNCDYNLTGNVSGICPECGTEVKG